MSKERDRDDLTTPSLSAHAVRTFLERNPDFLIDHADLIAALTPPARRCDGNIVDFRGRALDIMRRRLAQVDGLQADLMQVARTNHAGQARVHAAVLAALDADGIAHLAHVVTSDWVDMLGVDVITLSVEGSPRARMPMIDGIQVLEDGAIDGFLGGADAVLLHDGCIGDLALYGAAAALVRAEALIGLDLTPSLPRGLLALGCRDPDAFAPGQGTELLRFLGNVLERTILRWLSPTAR